MRKLKKNNSFILALILLICFISIGYSFLETDLNVGGVAEVKKPVSSGAKTLIAKANPIVVTDYNAGNKGEMYTFKHNSTTQVPTEVIDYRYIGAEPNNYITFNENEKWRIIGVFDGKIKIIRDEKIGDFAWDSTDVNEWPTSTLATYLNTGDYWTTVLSQEAREKIDTNIYYLGGSSTYDNLNASDYYNFERGTTVYSGRSTKWEGKVGLMYPSDYVYTFANGVDNKCFNDAYNCDASNPNASWLYKKSYVRWTIAPNSVNGSVAFFVGGSDGTVNGNYYYVDNIHGINPTVYLKSDIGLLGSGTVDDPYKIVS